MMIHLLSLHPDGCLELEGTASRNTSSETDAWLLGAMGRPKRPVGLRINTIAIKANIENMPVSGQSALAVESIKPTMRAPRRDPFKLPNPPTMTTAMAYKSTSISKPG